MSYQKAPAGCATPPASGQSRVRLVGVALLVACVLLILVVALWNSQSADDISDAFPIVTDSPGTPDDSAVEDSKPDEDYFYNSDLYLKNNEAIHNNNFTV